jgi:hypothetical protein
MKSVKRTGQTFAKEREYPCIRESDTGLVAIFTSENDAVVVFDPTKYSGLDIVGQRYLPTGKNRYHEFKGEIVLSND